MLSNPCLSRTSFCISLDFSLFAFSRAFSFANFLLSPLEDKLLNVCVVVKVFDFTVELYGNVSFAIPIAFVFHTLYTISHVLVVNLHYNSIAGFVKSTPAFSPNSSSPAWKAFIISFFNAFR